MGQGADSTQSERRPPLPLISSPLLYCPRFCPVSTVPRRVGAAPRRPDAPDRLPLVPLLRRPPGQTWLLRRPRPGPRLGQAHAVVRHDLPPHPGTSSFHKKVPFTTCCSPPSNPSMAGIRVQPHLPGLPPPGDQSVGAGRACGVQPAARVVERVSVHQRPRRCVRCVCLAGNRGCRHSPASLSATAASTVLRMTGPGLLPPKAAEAGTPAAAPAAAAGAAAAAAAAAAPARTLLRWPSFAPKNSPDMNEILDDIRAGQPDRAGAQTHTASFLLLQHHTAPR